MITIEAKDITQDLTLFELVLLKCICEGDKELFEICLNRIDGLYAAQYSSPMSTLYKLQEKLYIKIMSDTFEGLILREKGEKFKSSNVAVDFEEFWKEYHKITKLKATDKDESRTAWKRLKKNEIETAVNNIEAYHNSCNGWPRKAKYYLKYKLFNDEFKVNDSTRGNIFSLAGED